MSVCEFEKGIKHDLTLYPIFNDDQQYNRWYHDTYATADVHRCEQVFDPHYSPTETFHIFLWFEIKDQMFSVFC